MSAGTPWAEAMAEHKQEQMWAVCRTLSSDYEPWGDVPDSERGPDCSCGCQWFYPLEGTRGMDFGVCAGPRSARRGLLTCGHQAGWGCGFEQEPDGDA